MNSTIFLSISRFIFIFAYVLFCKQSFKIVIKISSHPEHVHTSLPLYWLPLLFDSRLQQRSQLLHDSHKVNISLTHSYLSKVKQQNFRILVFTSQLSNIDNVSVSILHYARLRLQQQILSPKPTHIYFVTPQFITDSRSQRLQLPR